VFCEVIALQAVSRENGTYQFGSYSLNAAERLLLRDGEPVPLAPKVFDTLVVLVEKSGSLVTKDDLMSRLWPDTFVEEGTITRNISDLRKALGESSSGGRYIETVPRHGYRFAAPVAIVEADSSVVIERHTRSKVVTEETTQEALDAGTRPRRRGLLGRTLIATLVLAALAAGVSVYLRYRSSANQPLAIRSVAVLPFRSLNTETNEDYLGLGIASDIITRVSQSGDLAVRPTSAVRKYLDKKIDALTAARELNLDAVLDSTFLHVGNRLRVSVNLLKVSGGAVGMGTPQVIRLSFTAPTINTPEVESPVSAGEQFALGLNLQGVPIVRLVNDTDFFSNILQLAASNRNDEIAPQKPPSRILDYLIQQWFSQTDLLSAMVAGVSDVTTVRYPSAGFSFLDLEPSTLFGVVRSARVTGMNLDIEGNRHRVAQTVWDF